MAKFKNIKKSRTDRPSRLQPLAGPIMIKASVKSKEKIGETKVPLTWTPERVSETRARKVGFFPLARLRTSVLILSVAVILQLALLVSLIYLSPYLNRYN